MTAALYVVRGAPTPEELAAVLAVLSSRAAPAAAPRARPLWSRPLLRAPIAPGPGAWRESTLPR